MKLDLNDIYKQASPFVVLECQLHDVASIIEGTKDDPNSVARVLRGQKCRTKQAFFDEVSAALQFPLYFGENWDAFEECITDVPELHTEKKYLLVVTYAEQLLADETYAVFEMLVQILIKAKFVVGLQVDESPQKEENFGRWLSDVEIPKISA